MDKWKAVYLEKGKYGLGGSELKPIGTPTRRGDLTS